MHEEILLLFFSEWIAETVDISKMVKRDIIHKQAI